MIHNSHGTMCDTNNTRQLSIIQSLAFYQTLNLVEMMMCRQIVLTLMCWATLSSCWHSPMTY